MYNGNAVKDGKKIFHKVLVFENKKGFPRFSNRKCFMRCCWFISDLIQSCPSCERSQGGRSSQNFKFLILGSISKRTKSGGAEEKETAENNNLTT